MRYITNKIYMGSSSSYGFFGTMEDTRPDRDEINRKIETVELKVDAIKEDMKSFRDEILHTIRAMPPVMGEGFASAASRFEFQVEEQKEGLVNRKTGKDE